MESNWKEYLDVLSQAPLATIILVFIYLHNKKSHKILEGNLKIIEKLIDKIKTS